MAQIRASTVLPADRRALTLHTADGLRLVGELAVPIDRPVIATTVWLHPLPTMGGSMQGHLMRKAANRLPALAGVAVLRLNTRGTSSAQGTSEGSFDGGEAERYDVAAALDRVEFDGLPAPWLVGWSFGADLALRYGCDPSVPGAVLLAPPLKYAGDPELARWRDGGKPLTAVVPEHDDYLRPDAARERFAAVPSARVVALPGARHLFVGHADAVLDEVVGQVAPSAAPLPRTWDGDT